MGLLWFSELLLVLRTVLSLHLITVMRKNSTVKYLHLSLQPVRHVHTLSQGVSLSKMHVF
jgi:hypothetical protein